MNEPVRILLLGPPVVFRGETRVEIPRREVRALLYVLASQDRAVSRDELIGLFWPDSSEELARKRLRETLTRLRQALDGDLLETSSEQVWLKSEGLFVDVRLFQRQAEEVSLPLAQLPAANPLPAPVYQKIEEAVNLWRAPTFLAGARLPGSVLLEEWHRRLGMELEHRYGVLLERLADHDLALGNLEKARHWLETATIIDALNDAVHERMVQVYERLGDFTGGLSYLKKVRALYQQEGLDETPEVLERADRRFRQALLSPRERNAAVWSSERLPQIPLFGREAELRLLQAGWRRGGVLFVWGEAGSGKTRLVRELYHSITPSPRLMVATARRLEGGLPFQPFIEMLRSQVAAEEWRELPKTWLSVLSLLLPELKVMFREISPQEVAPSFAPSLIFEALHQALLLFSRGRRLFFLLENAHWSDETSLTALLYLKDHGFFKQRGVLVVTARVAESTPALFRFASQCSEGEAMDEVRLLPLSTTAVAQLAAFVCGRELPPETVERLKEACGGNPLFLLESLRGLLAFPFLLQDPARLTSLPVSGSWQALVRQRLQGLSPRAEYVLSVAAAIGTSFRVDVLERACSLAAEEVLAALEELERLYLIVVQSSETLIQYEFVQERIREVLLQEMSPARRRLVHLRVAEALKKMFPVMDSGLAATLASHYEEAGEGALAFGYWLEAARYARRLSSAPEARAAFQRAAHLLDALGGQIPDAQVMELYTAWIEYGFDMAQSSEVRFAAEALLSQGQARENVALIRRGWLGLAVAADLCEDADEGLRDLEAVFPYLSINPDPSDWGRYYYERGVFLVLRHQYHEAARELEYALRLLEDSRDARQIEWCHNIRYRLALIYQLLGLPARGFEHASRAYEESRLTFNRLGSLRALTSLVAVEFFRGRFREALQYGLTALDMARATSNPRLQGTIFTFLAQAEMALGHLDDAWQHAVEAGDLVEGLAFGRVRSQACMIQGMILHWLGDLERAEGRYRESIEGVLTYVSADAMHRLGLLLVQRGRVEEGLSFIDQAVAFSREHDLGAFYLAGLLSRARGLYLLGQGEEARGLASQVAARATERELVWYYQLAYWLLSEIALSNGQADDARQKALALLSQIPGGTSPLVEATALRLVILASQNLGVDSTSFSTRLQSLVARLEERACSPALAELFQKRKADILGG
ncbi:protein containing AAA ATPase domain [Anaerolinea thermolimosa]|uniref:ATP-binding protein n=1 Tax=Anaerolinea thermolimosa TaxID=229919 RepID=UPI000784F32E|nr:AAA family ATPase [Anaerolinea thermolimosa]GAP08161.1 protein containing AAA ATPase domain [Anaerolinea thermolimosa]